MRGVIFLLDVTELEEYAFCDRNDVLKLKYTKIFYSENWKS